MDERSWLGWLREVPTPVVDAGLALALALAITVAIRVAPEQGTSPDLLTFGYGWSIAALALFRRRWPLAVLLLSAAILQIYYLQDNPGIFPAVPLSLALATAWAAGCRVWALMVAVWFGGSTFVYFALQAPQTLPALLRGSVPDIALLFAVLSVGEAKRRRRALDRAHQLLAAEQERSEQLLLNVLPAPIATRLKQGQAVIADRFPDVTVLFADLVDFTRHTDRMTPEQVVAVLNDLFSAFDRLAQRHGLEKIKTVGDEYMVAGGLPESRPDHAEAVAEMALEMRDEVARRADPSGRPLQVRIGIDTGPVIAGVIGTSKFSYDLWGNTVNTASRMESHGVPDCIQTTARTYQRLRPGFRFQRRGSIQVKGKGEMVTYFMVSRNEGRGPRT
jgi:class 3 adenylate cyclase